MFEVEVVIRETNSCRITRPWIWYGTTAVCQVQVLTLSLTERPTQRHDTAVVQTGGEQIKFEIGLWWPSTTSPTVVRKCREAERISKGKGGVNELSK